MTGNREDFRVAVQSLRNALAEVMEPKANDPRAELLSDLLENQLRGIDLFHQLLLSEIDGKFMIDDKGYDLLTQRYRAVMRFFTKFPGVDNKSIYEMLIVSDFYYLIHFHASEPTS